MKNFFRKSGLFLLGAVIIAATFLPSASEAASRQTKTRKKVAVQRVVKKRVLAYRWHKGKRISYYKYVPVRTAITRSAPAASQPVVAPTPVQAASSQPTPTPPAPIATIPIVSTTIISNTPYSIEGIANEINAARRANGLGEVRLNGALNKAATAKAKHMAENNYFAHVSPSGIQDWDFVKQSGYRYRAIGANLAKGDFGNSKSLVDAWMNSPGHRANILTSFGQEIGIGFDGNYYVMFIAQPL